MRAKFLPFFILIVSSTFFLSVSCSQNKPQVPKFDQKQTDKTNTAGDTADPVDDFYSRLKEKLNKVSIFAYNDPRQIPFFDFTLENLKGEKVSLSGYKGKVILLNFWATWCGPCREEMPSMQRLYDEYKDKGFVLVAVDLNEKKAAVEEFIRKNRYTFPVLLDSTGEVGLKYEMKYLPLSYLIDTDGFIVGGIVGGKDWNSDEIREIISFIRNKG